MNLKETYAYKNRLMEHICKNEEIVKLVTKNMDASVPNHTLPYTQVFPFEWVPETIDEAKTYICVHARPRCARLDKSAAQEV